MEVIFCFNCSRTTINILSIILAISVVFFINLNFRISKLNFDIVPANIIGEECEKEVLKEVITINTEEKNDSTSNFEWKIEIPKINLNANIVEGTSQEILNEYVGHFSETSCYDGNVGLAAHNRGYKVNYFEKLKELEIGDEIIYKYNGKIKKYLVEVKEIIKETDWSYLETTENNRITLITCVEDLPEYRRCIQGVEKKED